jgi:hypothetical protein
METAMHILDSLMLIEAERPRSEITNNFIRKFSDWLKAYRRERALR